MGTPLEERHAPTSSSATATALGKLLDEPCASGARPTPRKQRDAWRLRTSVITTDLRACEPFPSRQDAPRQSIERLGARTVGL